MASPKPAWWLLWLAPLLGGMVCFLWALRPEAKKVVVLGGDHATKYPSITILKVDSERVLLMLHNEGYMDRLRQVNPGSWTGSQLG